MRAFSVARQNEQGRPSMEEWVLENDVGKWDQRKDVENYEKYDEMCEKCCDAGRAILKYVDILKGVAQGCTLSPNLFKVYMI